MKTHYLPTAVIGIYQHPDLKTYHLRNLRTGQMLSSCYNSLADAASAQDIIEKDFYETPSPVLPPAAPDDVDALIEAFAQEMREWDKINPSFTFNLEADNARLSQ